MTVVQKGWAKVKGAAEYAGVCIETLEKWRKSYDLRHVKSPTGGILYRYEWIDQFLEGAEQTADRDDLGRIANEALSKVLN